MPPSSVDSPRDRPLLVLMTSHWLSFLGMGLVGTALISWLFVLPLHVRGHVDNPYIGVLVFMVIPIILVAGLVMVPVGVVLARRRARQRLTEQIVDRKAAIRRMAWFLGVVTVINVIVGTQATYRAVEHMESVQFCGQTCHVMTPEMRAHAVSPHARVQCVECHVGEGARGWLESKMSGTRQLIEVVFKTHPKPIPSAIETDKLVPARETCERCHWPEKFVSARLKVIPKFAEDEANTPSQTVLMMMVGGSLMPGIHGSHFGPGVEIRFAAVDKKRQKIPWVEYRNTRKGETRSYLAKDANAGAANGLPRYTMQCVDCHNRPTHGFELPDRAMDRAMTVGLLPATLPFLKKKGVELLKAKYASNDEAGRRIPAELAAYYRQAYPKVASERLADVDAAGKMLVRIYDTNVFPDLGVTWGLYPNNLGHDAFPGCFRCHDDEHKTADGKTITQDCGVCHEAVATEESSPEVLKTLGLDARILALRKP
ncbi:MAG TPA: NapC/NirT family cytochrome c [Thermoanaerobaculia bacterium]|nr:NapC/NirT family cytochrome c [Thermoanaerobaculia bacterium]